jgi:hypothetical protein
MSKKEKVVIQAGDLVKKHPAGGVWLVVDINTNRGGWGPGSVELRSIKDPSYFSYLANRDIKQLIKVS